MQVQGPWWRSELLQREQKLPVRLPPGQRERLKQGEWLEWLEQQEQRQRRREQLWGQWWEQLRDQQEDQQEKQQEEQKEEQWKQQREQVQFVSISCHF